MRFVNRIANDSETIDQTYQDFVDGEYPDTKPFFICDRNTQLGMGCHVQERPDGIANPCSPFAKDKPRPERVAFPFRWASISTDADGWTTLP